MATDARTKTLLHALTLSLQNAYALGTTAPARHLHLQKAGAICDELHHHIRAIITWPDPRPKGPFVPRTTTSRDGPGRKGLRQRHRKSRAREAAKRTSSADSDHSPTGRLLDQMERRRED